MDIITFKLVLLSVISSATGTTQKQFTIYSDDIATLIVILIRSGVVPRRSLFRLKPGAFNNITVGIVYGRGTEGSAYASVNALKRADTKAQALFDNCFKILDPPMAPKLTIQELENGLVLMLDIGQLFR